MERGAPPKDLIGYLGFTQAAKRSVVRSAIQRAVELKMLPGDHHFWITFRTNSPGVQMADYLKDKFTEEMTIVIQHQYWDLEVSDEAFEVILRFSGVPQHLRVPFSAITRFADPSIGFQLSFDEPDLPQATPSIVQTTQAAAPKQSEPSSGDSTVISFDAFRRK
jgi:uncharacterized protein